MIFLLGLTACNKSPSQPVIHFASENSIAIKYNAYDVIPTVTAEAIDIAVKHCKRYGKKMTVISSNQKNMNSPEEIHTFMCTNHAVEIKTKYND